MKSDDHTILPERITVGEPHDGVTLVYSVEPGQIIHLDIPLDDVVFSRQETHLHLDVEAGGAVILENFFETGGRHHELPGFELTGGERLEGAELLSAVSSSLPVGPCHICEEAHRAPLGSGLSEYHAHSGDLIHGINSFGKGEPIFLEDILDPSHSIDLGHQTGAFMHHTETFSSTPGEVSVLDAHGLTAFDLSTNSDDLSLLANPILPHIL